MKDLTYQKDKKKQEEEKLAESRKLKEIISVASEENFKNIIELDKKW